MADLVCAALPQRPWLFQTLTAFGLCVLLWSFLGAADQAVWAFELLPLIVLLLVFAVRRRQFCFSDLAYVLLTIFLVIQCLGGRYTFEHVPLPDELLEWFGFKRNPADRIGHFFQGVVPAIVLRDNDLFMLIGGPGGSRIPTAVLQVFLNVVDFGMNPQEAVDAPRFHHQWLPDAISVERGFSPDALALLRSRGHEVREEQGAVAAVVELLVRDKGWLQGAADGRRFGRAAGY